MAIDTTDGRKALLDIEAMSIQLGEMGAKQEGFQNKFAEMDDQKRAGLCERIGVYLRLASHDAQSLVENVRKAYDGIDAYYKEYPDAQD